MQGTDVQQLACWNGDVVETEAAAASMENVVWLAIVVAEQSQFAGTATALAADCSALRESVTAASVSLESASGVTESTYEDTPLCWSENDPQQITNGWDGCCAYARPESPGTMTPLETVVTPADGGLKSTTQPREMFEVMPASLIMDTRK